MTTFIDLHVLHTVPPSNLNRDDLGSPKTAVYGGVRRARVSSQAWKRAVRVAFGTLLDPSEVGYRTKRLVELVAAKAQELDPALSQEQALAGGKKALNAIGVKTNPPRVTEKKPETAGQGERTDYLVFLSAGQIDGLAQAVVDAGDSAIDKKAAKAIANTAHSIDIALFGRMVADDATLNVDAAVQVAHALSTHAVDTEFDYYTAVDDLNPKEDTGAGMIGTIEFNSSTLYRYATINVDMLRENLGSTEAAAKAASAFATTFATAIPSGKQNSFANGTLPDAVVAVVREDQPVNLSGAFEDAVSSSGTGLVAASAQALAAHAKGVDAVYGSGRRDTWVVAMPACGGHLDALGETVSLPELVGKVQSVVEAS